MGLPLLELKSISKSWPGVRALDGIDFSLEVGEVHALIGENGAGKSTMIKILTGAIRADAGEIILDGRSHAGLSIKQAQDLGIGAIYQELNLIPNLSIAENIFFGREFRKRGMVDFRRMNREAGEILSRMGFDLDPRLKVGQIGTAWQQIVEIAIAVSKNTRILIMDEPTAPLSTEEVGKLFQLIRRLKADGVSIIYISHRLEEIKRIGDRVTVLRDGASIATVDPKAVDTKDLIALMVGKSMSTRGERVSWPVGGSHFEVRGLVNRNFPEPIALRVRENEILGITGLVGSSKTELARAIFGIDRCASKELLLGGRRIDIKGPRSAVGLGIGYLPEDRDSCGLCLNMGVKENMTLVSLAKLRTLFFSHARERATVQDIVDSIRVMTPGLSQQVKYLSGGNKQKVVLGKWLMADCRLLILDEPTIGIDVGARSEIYELIRTFVRTGDRSVIFISSDMDEIQEISGRILVMSKGRIVADLDPDSTSKEEIMQYSLGAKKARTA